MGKLEDISRSINEEMPSLVMRHNKIIEDIIEDELLEFFSIDKVEALIEEELKRAKEDRSDFVNLVLEIWGYRNKGIKEVNVFSISEKIKEKCFTRYSGLVSFVKKEYKNNEVRLLLSNLKKARKLLIDFEEVVVKSKAFNELIKRFEDAGYSIWIETGSSYSVDIIIELSFNS